MENFGSGNGGQCYFSCSFYTPIYLYIQGAIVRPCKIMTSLQLIGYELWHHETMSLTLSNGGTPRLCHPIKWDMLCILIICISQIILFTDNLGILDFLYPTTSLGEWDWLQLRKSKSPPTLLGPRLGAGRTFLSTSPPLVFYLLNKNLASTSHMPYSLNWNIQSRSKGVSVLWSTVGFH